MKKTVIYLVVLSFVFSGMINKVFSQWTTSGTNVYYNGGNVGIGTNTPAHALSVKGRLSVFPATIQPMGAYRGSLFITQAKASGQYINLVRDGMYPWSIGTVYNTNDFAIGQGEGTDANFTNPYLVVTAYTGNLLLESKSITNSSRSKKIEVYGSKSTTESDKGESPASINLNQVWNNIVYPASIKAQSMSDYLNSSAGLVFTTSIWNGSAVSTSEKMRITPTGNVGIGTTNPGTKLDVAGTIRAQEVKVCLNQGCDFVFAPDYDLMPLHELDSFISENNHLPEVAPAAVMEAEGISLSEMNAKLLQKIEELTLYMIAQDKKTAELEKRSMELEKEVESLKSK